MKSNSAVYESNISRSHDFPFAMGALSWRYTPPPSESTVHSPYQIDFDMEFKDGSSLGQKKYESLLVLLQKYLHHIWMNHPPSALYKNFIYLRPFLYFTVEARQATRFDELWDVDGFIFYAKDWILNRERGKSGRHAKIVKPAALYKYLHPVKSLWIFTKGMPDGLRAEPWVGRTSSRAAGVKAATVNAVLPYSLPEFYAIVRAAQSTLADVTQVTKELQLSLGTQQFPAVLAKASSIRNSAAVLILAFTAIRPETLVALSHDSLKPGVLMTEHGEIKVMWLHGRIFKDRPPGGEAWQWIASEEVVAAVQALLVLKRALNVCADNPRCREDLRDAIHASNPYLLPKFAKSSSRGGQLITTALLHGVKNFIRTSSSDGLPSAKNVTLNRFRPTLARILARLGLGDIRYFMHHYGHTRIGTTMGYFGTFADDEFNDDVAEATMKEMQIVVHDILSSKTPLAGKRGKELEPLRRQYAVMTFKGREEIRSHFANGYDLKIQLHSFCMAQKGTKLCPPNCTYEELKCIGCHNGVVTEDNLLIWGDIKIRTEALADEFPIGSPAHEAWTANIADINATISTITGKAGVS